METFSALPARLAVNSPVNSPHKGQWRGALMFSLICAWTNGWVNNRDVGDLGRYGAHHDVNVMILYHFATLRCWNHSSSVFLNHPFITYIQSMSWLLMIWIRFYQVSKLRKFLLCHCAISLQLSWIISSGKRKLVSRFQNGRHFPRRYFQMHFHEWTVLYFDSNCTEVCSKGSNGQ